MHAFTNKILILILLSFICLSFAGTIHLAPMHKRFKCIIVVARIGRGCSSLGFQECLCPPLCLWSLSQLVVSVKPCSIYETKVACSGVVYIVYPTFPIFICKVLIPLPVCWQESYPPAYHPSIYGIIHISSHLIVVFSHAATTKQCGHSILHWCIDPPKQRVRGLLVFLPATPLRVHLQPSIQRRLILKSKVSLPSILWSLLFLVRPCPLIQPHP